MSSTQNANKVGGASRASARNGNKPLSRLDQFLYSGEKKHVAAGILIFAAIGAIPWLLFTRDVKHQSHEDYMDNAEKAKQAEKARQARLSSS
ncbi:hypothetical protein KP509_21G087200 [Ceratopteris richardii]|uniref:Transmembrane protein n=1 Tax=Ceratopteris richardii TaxID=49495 RepID=A0A8T2SFL8_CERRI|nr:hypothetical protein KP509_21G087200 [Ceratopteris richardii]